MSSLAELSLRLTRLKEISGIMSDMKSLAWMERRRLSRFLEHQHRMLANMEAAAGDFLGFYPPDRIRGPSATLVIAVGSERGFCGNFNERVLDALPAPQSGLRMVVLGQRLGAKVHDRPDVIARLEGPGVTEDVPGVLDRLMDVLYGENLPLSDTATTILTLAHEAEGEPVMKPLLPLAPPKRSFPYPPRLQLAPPVFFAELLDQYLLAALTGRLYDSLSAENRQRLAHMEQALDRLGETLGRLVVRRNRLRQEHIVEEIEVILSGEQTLRHGP